MKRIFSLFFLLIIMLCETQGFLHLVINNSICCMASECDTEEKNDCSSSDKMPLCCRVCCLTCVYIVPETISIAFEETLKPDLFVFNEALCSFYVFDTFQPPELYI